MRAENTQVLLVETAGPLASRLVMRVTRESAAALALAFCVV